MKRGEKDEVEEFYILTSEGGAEGLLLLDPRISELENRGG